MAKRSTEVSSEIAEGKLVVCISQHDDGEHMIVLMGTREVEAVIASLTKAVIDHDLR